MRTTLTLEDDVAVRLEKLREERDDTFKGVVNEVLRRGLDALEKPRAEREPYVMKTWDAGECLAPNLDSMADTLAWAEGEDFK